MKPHLRYSRRVWSCISPRGWSFIAGYGYTPREAYADWESKKKEIEAKKALRVSA